LSTRRLDSRASSPGDRAGEVVSNCAKKQALRQ
jgi:hypothetical protein